ncbi:MAG: iron-containing alcohol dehydrogenase [Duodenibacillus massiliensis]
MGNGVIRPKVAAINPELFFTLPKKQVAAGVIDMMSHIMERYFDTLAAEDYTSGQAEAALKTIYGKRPKSDGKPSATTMPGVRWACGHLLR